MREAIFSLFFVVFVVLCVRIATVVVVTLCATEEGGSIVSCGRADG